MGKIMISVIGGSETNANCLRVAEEVGAEIARRGAVLVCGGLGGVMEAACRAAKREGGITVGIIPTSEHSDANDYVDIVIPTAMGYARNFLVARSGHGVIAIDGLAGTLSEIAIAWFTGRPIAAISSTGGWAARLAGEQIDNRREDVIYPASSAVDAVEYIMSTIEREHTPQTDTPGF